MCSASEAGSYLRLIDFVYHSTLGLRVIKKAHRPCQRGSRAPAPPSRSTARPSRAARTCSPLGGLLPARPRTRPCCFRVLNLRTSTCRNVNRFRGGLVFKAHRLVYHSTLDLRVIMKKKKKKKKISCEFIHANVFERAWVFSALCASLDCLSPPPFRPCCGTHGGCSVQIPVASTEEAGRRAAAAELASLVRCCFLSQGYLAHKKPRPL